MKLGRLLMAGAMMTASSYASAGAFVGIFDFDVFTKHEVKMKLNGVEQGGDGFKTKQGDIGALLCGRELTKDEELVVYMPCGISSEGGLLDIDDLLAGLGPEDELFGGEALLAVANKETNLPVPACDGEIFDWENPIFEFDKDGNVKRVYTIINGDVVVEGDAPINVDLVFSSRIKYKEIKDKEELGIGLNCAREAKCDSILGGDDFGVDYLYRKGNCNLKKRQAVVGTEILNIID
jgi:hypothetical protein